MKNRNPMKNHVLHVQIKIISFFFSLFGLLPFRFAFCLLPTMMLRSYQREMTKEEYKVEHRMPLDHCFFIALLTSPHFMINRFSMFSLVNNTKTHLNKKIRFSFFLGISSPAFFLSFFISLLTLNIHFFPQTAYSSSCSILLHLLHSLLRFFSTTRSLAFSAHGLFVDLLREQRSCIIIFYINNKAIFHVMNLLNDENILRGISFTG